MSTMISKTYVNEIDVSKVKTSQKVEIIVDAFPDRNYTGTVINVANIGEQLPNADAKVFEVLIKVDGSDPILKPSMTTGNKIVTKTINDVTYIPLECVQAGPDSIPFVYTKNKTKQIVVLGESNENNVIVEQGLEAGETLYLSTPEAPENYKLAGGDLKTIIKDREKAAKDEELRIRSEAEKAVEDRARMMGITPEMMQQFQNRSGNMQFGQGNRQGGTRDTSARRRMMNFQDGQGGVRDTAAMRRRMMEFQNGQRQGGTRDTTAQRRNNTQVIRQNN